MKKYNSKNDLFQASDMELVCPKQMVWDEMEIVGERKRLCDGCDKVLVDVTGYTKEEVATLQKKDKGICVAVTNVLVATSLSVSTLCATEEADLNTSKEKIIQPVPIVELPPPVTLGLPALPTCDEGTVNLNAIKRFFGFEVDRSCYERD